MKIREKIITGSDGLKFYTREFIPDSTPKGIVFLVHGLSDHGGRFEHVATAFAESGMVFFAPDLRGNGKTTGRRGHFKSGEQVTADFDFLIHYIKSIWPGLPFTFFSQSMGGNLALNYLLKHPEQVKAAVISSPWLALTKKPGYFTLLMGKLLVKAAPWLLQNNNLKASDLCHDTSICTRYENDPLIHWKISLKAFFVIEESAAYCMQHASDVALPILLLHSQTDPITSFNASEQFFKSANNFVEFRAFTGLLHELHNETTHPEILKGVVNWVLNAV